MKDRERPEKSRYIFWISLLTTLSSLCLLWVFTYNVLYRTRKVTWKAEKGQRNPNIKYWQLCPLFILALIENGIWLEDILYVLFRFFVVFLRKNILTVYMYIHMRLCIRLFVYEILRLLHLWAEISITQVILCSMH